ncbi:RepB family plasmid replication initiator protein [Paraburkholderia kirstenboschensis]|uniref:RepB family plasmid replication initiator protein n=1 Tax=Paraburkholderia kirstenboschensis TaxID=1245436 RepID=A0ABZ0E8Z0_9BURK|nr:RepB family plasmid replication initiator protein [Paraburkholderia kirstenboschensis]WOD13705.1 RepB family plasmid replication initiator protein [Paraburkholderia kirstenboschensis]
MSTAGQVATSRQLALALFEDATAEDLPLDAARSDIGFARKNVLIRIIDLGVAARRLIDAAYFIVAQEEQPRDLYDVELDYFKWLMRYSSRNNAHLEQVITEAQRALIQATTAADADGTKPFGSVQLIGRISYQGGRFQFRVPPDLIGIIRGPGKSHWLSLRITSLFTLSYARVMYDHLLPYADDGATDWFELDELRSWQGAMGAKAHEFKYFKRDWLAPAVDQINEVSDLKISYETRNEPGSRKIGRLRFRIERKELAERVLHTHEQAQALYRTMKQEFGLSSAQLNQIAADRDTYTDERLEQAIERTRFSLKLGNISKSPAGFFMKALREQWIVSDAERQMVQIQESLAQTEKRDLEEKQHVQTRMALRIAAQDVHAQDRMVEEVRRGWAAYEAATIKQREDWRRTYKGTPAGKLTLRRLGIDPGADLSDAMIEKYPDLKDGFAGYVFNRSKTGKSL